MPEGKRAHESLKEEGERRNPQSTTEGGGGRSSLNRGGEKEGGEAHGAKCVRPATMRIWRRDGERERERGGEEGEATRGQSERQSSRKRGHLVKSLGEQQDDKSEA